MIPLTYNKNEFESNSIDTNSSCVYILKNPIDFIDKDSCHITIKTINTDIQKKLENGDKNNDDHYKEYETAVLNLMQICEQIILFIKNNEIFIV